MCSRIVNEIQRNVICARRVCIDGILECRGPMLLYPGAVVVGYDMSQSLTHDGLRFDSEFPLKLEAVLCSTM